MLHLGGCHKQNEDRDVIAFLPGSSCVHDLRSHLVWDCPYRLAESAACEQRCVPRPAKESMLQVRGLHTRDDSEGAIAFLPCRSVSMTIIFIPCGFSLSSHAVTAAWS